jgi:hypothetical protein
MSALLRAIEKTLYLAPCRCGRTYYGCDISILDDSIRLKFTPTDKFLSLDPRREDEIFMPTHIHTFEKWQHIGLAVGSLECVLKESNIDYKITNNEEYVEFIVLQGDIDSDFNTVKQQTLKHAHRSFDFNSNVDEETFFEISSMIDQFLLENNPGYKIMITDQEIRKKIYALAIYWETMGEKNGDIKAPQMNAPLLISVPPTEFDTNYWFNMGRLYSKIGLLAILKGYQLAFCNVLNYFDPRIARVEDTLHIKYGTYTVDNFIPRPWICIGKGLDMSKPFNWISHNDTILPSCILVTKDFIQIKEKENFIV